MSTRGALCTLSQRLQLGLSIRTMASSLPHDYIAGTCEPSCSTRSYSSQAEERSGGTRRAFRRPMRYGSKLAIRDPVRFRRMKAILGYPDDATVEKVDRVTISTLQTMKYLMSGSENVNLLQGMASYKVTTLNRDLLPLLDRTEALLRGK